MKTYFSFQNVLAFGLVLMLLFTSCQTDEFTETAVVKEDPTTTETAEETDPTLRINTSFVFPTTARVFGKCTEDWAIEFGKKGYTLDCEKVSQSQMLILSDKVVAPYGSFDDTFMEYTIKKDQVVLFSPAYILYDYPCPAEFEFEPAEGQSLENFLKVNAKETINTVQNIEILLDGIEIEEIDKYRLSTDLFYFTGNPDLTACSDPCVTGEPQPGVVDGYFMMFKPMKTGKHTLILKGEIPSAEITFEVTIILNVVK